MMNTNGQADRQAEKFLSKLRGGGGAIVSAGDLPADEIENARRSGRLFASADGSEYVYESLD